MLEKGFEKGRDVGTVTPENDRMPATRGPRATQVLCLLMLICLAVVPASLRGQQNGPGETVTRPVISESDLPVISLAPVSSDEVAGEAFLRKPPGEGPFPAVILVHGGAARWETDTLRQFMLHIHASRFLAEGYVVVAMTRRALDMELPADEVQPSVRDAIAVYDYVRSLDYVDDDSVVVRGTSVGGFLTLEVAAARDTVAAIAVEEPFSFPFVGVSPGADNGGSLDTSKIAAIEAPILLLRGDQTPSINEFNRDAFIPALEADEKQLVVRTYPGQLHSFAFYDNEERTPDAFVSLQAFRDIDRFFREHLEVQPQALNDALVDHEPVQE